MSAEVKHQRIIESETKVVPCACCGEPVTLISGIMSFIQSCIEAEFIVQSAGHTLDVAIVIGRGAALRPLAFLWGVTCEMPELKYLDSNAWPKLAEHVQVLSWKRAKKHKWMLHAQEAVQFLLRDHGEVAKLYHFLIDQGASAIH